MVILALTRLSGTIAQYQNHQQAFLQSIIVLAVAACWLFQTMGTRWKVMRLGILVFYSNFNFIYNNDTSEVFHR